MQNDALPNARDEVSRAQYESRVVAFVDILGFRSLLVRMVQEPALFETIRDALESVMEYQIAFQQAVEPESGSSATGLEMTAFSDCYVLSAKTGNELFIVNLTRQLALCLLEVGVICRGAIVIGDLYHEHPVVFGQAMANAYELETSTAFYPRILIDSQIAASIRRRDEEIGTTCSEGILRDSDGCDFLNLFHIFPKKHLVTEVEASGRTRSYVHDSLFPSSFYADSLFLRIRGQIVGNLLRELKASHRNLNRVSKLRWLAAKFNDAMARDGTRIPPIDADSPEHEKEWKRSDWIREGRELRPKKLTF